MSIMCAWCGKNASPFKNCRKGDSKDLLDLSLAEQAYLTMRKCSTSAVKVSPGRKISYKCHKALKLAMTREQARKERKQHGLHALSDAACTVVDTSPSFSASGTPSPVRSEVVSTAGSTKRRLDLSEFSPSSQAEDEVPISVTPVTAPAPTPSARDLFALFTEVVKAAGHHPLRLVALADHQVTIVWFDSAEDGRVGYPGRAASQATVTRTDSGLNCKLFLLHETRGCLVLHCCIHASRVHLTCVQPQALRKRRIWRRPETWQDACWTVDGTALVSLAITISYVHPTVWDTVMQCLAAVRSAPSVSGLSRHTTSGKDEKLKGHLRKDLHVSSQIATVHSQLCLVTRRRSG